MKACKCGHTFDEHLWMTKTGYGTCLQCECRQYAEFVRIGWQRRAVRRLLMYWWCVPLAPVLAPLQVLGGLVTGAAWVHGSLMHWAHGGRCHRCGLPRKTGVRWHTVGCSNNYTGRH